MQMQIKKTSVDHGALKAARERLAFGRIQGLHDAAILNTHLGPVEEKRRNGELITCASEDTCQYYDVLGLIGSDIVANKEALKGQSVAMIVLDKSRQNSINYLLGKVGGGNASLCAAISCIEKATEDTFGPLLTDGNKPYKIRYSPFSDEFTIIVVAKGITMEMLDRFQVNLDREVENVDLSKFPWETKNGEVKVHNLESASHILRYPRLVARSRVNGKMLWKVDSLKEKDFLIKGAADADLSKLHFIGDLPPAYRDFQGIPDVISPFDFVLNGGRLPAGTVVEIKLKRNISEMDWKREADLLMTIAVRDAKKGLYELEGLLGRRIFNVLAGVSGCNAILVAPILKGAHTFSQEHDVIVVPSDDMNFLFIGAVMDNNLLQEIGRHVSDAASDHFMPHISAMPSEGFTSDQLRPEFELVELGMRGRVTHDDLENVNLLINLIENASESVKRRVLNGVGSDNRDAIVRVEEMFREMRTIRHVQDFTYSAKATGRADLVQWLWGFSQKHAGAIRNRLEEFYSH